MRGQEVHERRRPRHWLFGGRGGRQRTRSELRRAIEREFLYRGVSSLEVKTVDLIQDTDTVTVEFYATPVHMHDERLRYTPWAVLFVEQVMADACRVLRAVWAEAPSLDVVRLKVLRRTRETSAADETILHLHATGDAVKHVILRAGKDAPAALLQRCDVRYDFDPRQGLRGLPVEGDVQS